MHMEEYLKNIKMNGIITKRLQKSMINKQDIRRLRLGCSVLADHTGYNYTNPNKCPMCKNNLIETNEHYVEECMKYQKERTLLHRKLDGILQKNNLQFNTKTLLGFIWEDKIKKDDFYYVLNEIFYHVNWYINKTERFTITGDINKRMKYMKRK